MKNTHSVALLGGPSSGKSTYLGALLDDVESESSPLSLNSQPPDMSAFEAITDPILDGQFPDRTLRGTRRNLQLDLQWKHLQGNPFNFDLVAGDYDGEQVSDLFNNRLSGWSEEWHQRAKSNALLLFIRPEHTELLPRFAPITPVAPTLEEQWKALRGHMSTPTPNRPSQSSPPTRIELPQQAFGKVGAAALETEQAPPPDQTSPVRLPSALSLIELLQFIRHTQGYTLGERPPQGKLRLAILISAWDALDAPIRAQGPRAYLRSEMHLLEDFLCSNFHGDDVMRFGLSSVGGNLADATYREKFQARKAAGYVVFHTATDSNRQRNDISLPLRWALFGNPALEGT